MSMSLSKKKTRNLNTYSNSPFTSTSNTNNNEENDEIQKKKNYCMTTDNSNTISNNINNILEICHTTEEEGEVYENNILKTKKEEEIIENENDMILQDIVNHEGSFSSFHLNSNSMSISIDDIKSEDMASSSKSSSALSLTSNQKEYYQHQHQPLPSSLLLQQQSNLDNKKNNSNSNKNHNYSNKNCNNNCKESCHDSNIESSFRDYFYDTAEYSCDLEDIQHNNDEIMEKSFERQDSYASGSNLSRNTSYEDIDNKFDESFESCEYNMSENEEEEEEEDNEDDDNDYDDYDPSYSSENEDNNNNNDHLNEEVEIENTHHHEDDEEENKMNDINLQKKQQNIRKQILDIQKDTSLSESEKARKIQNLMTSSYNTKHKVQNNNITNYQPIDKIDYDKPLTEEEKAATYHNKEKNILGCKHYQRALKIQAHCCGKWFPCRFCHDEVSDHSITSKALTVRMMCMYCSTVQPVNDICINPNCEKRVARYYCSECKLWDNDPNKNIYHCYDCGICRIGKGLGIDYFHCKTCNVCMSISLKGHHKCIERNLESNCPICGEYMFTSTTTVIFMPCGHCIHHKCYKEYIQTSYQCPTCFKSLANMTEYFKRIDQLLAQQQMPEEYKNWRSYILCNDCEKKSYAKFHFIYHKCAYCSSYNTKLIKTYDATEAASLPSDIMTNNTEKNYHQ